MLGERPDVAVVEVQAGGQRVELVDRAAAGRDLARAEPGHAVHLGRVDAVEVDRVRVRRAVDERDPQPVALAAAQRRAGDAAVVGPRGERDAGRDLDLLVDRDELPLAQRRGRRPAGVVVPQSKSRRISCGSKPLAAWSTVRAVAEARVAAVRRRGRRGGGAAVRRAAARLGSVPRVAVGDDAVQRGGGAADGGNGCGEQAAATESAA